MTAPASEEMTCQEFVGTGHRPDRGPARRRRPARGRGAPGRVRRLHRLSRADAPDDRRPARARRLGGLPAHTRAGDRGVRGASRRKRSALGNPENHAPRRADRAALRAGPRPRKRSRLSSAASIRVRQDALAAALGRPPGSRGSSARSPGHRLVGTTVSSGSPRTRASWSPCSSPATCTDPSTSSATRSAGSGTTANSTWSSAGPSSRSMPPTTRGRREEQPVGAPLAQLERSGAALRRLGRLEPAPPRRRARRDDPELRRGQRASKSGSGAGRMKRTRSGRGASASASAISDRLGGGGAPALDVGEDRRGAERGPVLEANPWYAAAGAIPSGRSTAAPRAPGREPCERPRTAR